MKCYYCNTELRWDRDIDVDHDIYNMISFLSCSKCEADVEVYQRRPKEKTRIENRLYEFAQRLIKKYDFDKMSEDQLPPPPISENKIKVKILS